MSICIHCGQDHDATVRICPKTSKAIAFPAQSGTKTMFGVPSAPNPGPPVPASAPGKLASPAALPLSRPEAPRNLSSPLTLGKTMVGVPSSPRPPEPARPASPTAVSPPGAVSGLPSFIASNPVPGRPSAPLPPPASPPVRLPTEEEARQDPDLVISLDFTPLPRRSSAQSAAKAELLSDLAAAATPVDLPN
ncbi:MAG TPA: hypothetical protein VIM14_16850, partial [Polyangia bacterium]